MPNNLESIINDLYELDPTLRAEDTAVRAVVASLLANKPVVLPDRDFVADLRAKLMVAHSTRHEIAKPLMSPWLMYFAPVGVVAILVFMLVPKPLSHQTVPTMETEPVLMDSAAETQSESFDESANAKRSFVAPETSPSADMRTMGTMEMAMPVEISGESFSIPTQQPGQLVKVDFVSFIEPTFLVIQTERQGYPGEVVGVSQPLNGQVEKVEVVLMRAMLKDETFFATAFRDNGDGIYTPTSDSLVYDSSGTQPLQQMFSTNPN